MKNATIRNKAPTYRAMEARWKQKQMKMGEKASATGGKFIFAASTRSGHAAPNCENVPSAQKKEAHTVDCRLASKYWLRKKYSAETRGRGMQNAPAQRNRQGGETGKYYAREHLFKKLGGREAKCRRMDVVHQA
jgi:hypothetical protein